jgi:FkbM family methyltransferase
VRVPESISNLLDKAGLSSNSPLRSKANGFVASRRNTAELKKIRPTLSYAQFGEDAVLQAYLPEGTGFYVDIGSGHPIQGSNTYALYQKGWHGIMVDPVESNISLSQRVRPRDRSVHAAVGKSDQNTIDFIEFETYQYSTTSEERAAEILDLGHPIRDRYAVSIIGLDEIISYTLMSSPTVLSVDVEGQEINVLESNDWNAFKPDFILIEDLDPPWTTRTNVLEFLEEKDYKLVAITGVTCLYLR